MVLVITELSRMSRSLSHLLEIIEELKNRCVDLRSSATGRAVAKARGKSGGPPRTDSDKLEQARILYQNSDKSSTEMVNTLSFFLCLRCKKNVRFLNCTKKSYN